MNFLKIFLDIYNFHARIPLMTENISECIDSYIDYLHALGKSDNTRISYRVDLRHFEDYLEGQGITEAAKIDTRAVRIFISSIIGVGEAKTSASRRLSAVRGFTAWLAGKGVVSSDPSVGMKGPKKPDALPRAISRADVERLLTNGPDPKSEHFRRDRLVLELLYGAGLRVSELIGLTWDKVELDERVLMVMGKGDKERMAPFGVPVQKLLEEWRDITCVKPDGPVFPSEREANRLTVRTVSRIVTRAANHVGLHGVTPHTLRHCYATHMLENGAPLKVVQELLGHDSIAATQRYLRITPALIKKSYSAAHPLAAHDDGFDFEEEA